MKKKNIGLVAIWFLVCIIISSCVNNYPNGTAPAATSEVTTTEAATTAATTTTEAVKEEVRLEWGMGVNEVKSAETYELTGEDTAEIDGSKHTLLRYKKVPFMEHNTQMALFFGDDGLDRINYKIVSENPAKTYNEIYQNLLEIYGGESYYSNDLMIWHNESNGITVCLAHFNSYVIYRIIPLMAEDEQILLLDFLKSGGELDENGSRIKMLIDMNRTEYTSNSIDCDPIDKTLDCEKILLEKADEIQNLFNDFLRLGGGDVFEFGDWESVKGFPTHLDAKEARSDEIKTIKNIKSRLNESIYDKYTDYLMQQQYGEVDGKLYRLEGARGSWLGVNETWYIGYDVTDDKIIGHFAVLGWGDDDDYGVKNPDHLNDINSYEFYDITVQNVGGKYVVTDVRGTTKGDGTPIPYDYFECHGCYYNCDVADRSLITNEAVKPKN